MKKLAGLMVMGMLLTACSEGPESGVKYHFSSKDEYLKYYLPLESDHGGVRKWVKAKDADCHHGKHMTLGDGFEVIFCPANGDESFFKLGS